VFRAILFNVETILMYLVVDDPNRLFVYSILSFALELLSRCMRNGNGGECWFKEGDLMPAAADSAK
jgi:hypothetical protein